MGNRPYRMLKRIVMHDIPMDSIATMERWYYKDHSPESVRRFGLWEAQHDSHRPRRPYRAPRRMSASAESAMGNSSMMPCSVPGVRDESSGDRDFMAGSAQEENGDSISRRVRRSSSRSLSS